MRRASSPSGAWRSTCRPDRPSSPRRPRGRARRARSRCWRRAEPMTLRVAVVGSGPAGFFACEELLKHDGFEVDLYDALPTPFGLVRAGVAPDHPKIKTVTRRYEKTAQEPRFRFFGCVELGADVERDELLERYHAIVYAVGTRDDNRLGIA